MWPPSRDAVSSRKDASTVLRDEHAHEHEECKSMCLLGALDAGGEFLYSPQLVTCLSLTRGSCWMKEYRDCFTDCKDVAREPWDGLGMPNHAK